MPFDPPPGFLPAPFACPCCPWKFAGRSPQPLPVGTSSESLLPPLPLLPLFTTPADAVVQIAAAASAAPMSLETRMRSLLDARAAKRHGPRCALSPRLCELTSSDG